MVHTERERERERLEEQKGEASSSDTQCIVCLDKPAEFEITGCCHTVLCKQCVQEYLNVPQGVIASIKRNCPICREQVWLLTTKEDASTTSLVYAPGVGYSNVKELVTRTFFTPVGLFWRYYFLPGVAPSLPAAGIHYYLHSQEERGRVTLQGGWDQPSPPEQLP